MQQVRSHKNLKEAEKKSQKGKKGKYGCVKYNKHRTKYFMQLYHALREGTFHSSPYKKFTIVADQGKVREISKLPYYPDRIVHHAIVNVIERKRVRSFIRDTFCCIKGRGLMDGTNRLQHALKHHPEETKYCLKIDLKKYFPSVDQQVLSDEMHRLYKDKEFLALIDDIIFSTDKGLPIGSLTSQLFANIYLSPLDHYMKDRLGVKYYYRYCDDIVVLSDHKGYLKWALREIKKFASERLHLTVKPTEQLFEVEKVGIDFMGYKFFHDYRILRKSIRQRFWKYMKRAKSDKRKQAVLAAYKGWCQHCNARKLWRTVTGLDSYELPREEKPSKLRKRKKSMSPSAVARRRRSFFRYLDKCEEEMWETIREQCEGVLPKLRI